MENIPLNIRLKELRTDLKMNQVNFAEEIGVTQSTLSSYESGNASPSHEVLLAIAKRFNISLDWLFGISQRKVNFSTLGDIVDFFFLIDEFNELGFEFEINDKLPNDTETESNKWHAGIRFYGNDSKHEANADFCQFLRSFRDNRRDYETYFTSRELYEIWQSKKVEYYSSHPLTKKVIEEIDDETFRERRNEYMRKEYVNDK